MYTPSISLSQLESHLWEAANILRGPVDAADFKTYVFPLLFFKRLSDVHDEEYRAALELYDGDEESARLFPENYGFQVPAHCHWRDVRAVTTNVGQALQTALRGIEQANPHTLYGIFGDAQWTNKDRLSDALLRDLVEHFSQLPLGNTAAKTDVLGQSYEYLIKKFADTTNKKAGEFYTPRSVVRLMVNLLDPREGESIYDPACGTGGMLLEAIHHVQETHGDVRTLWGKLCGQEKNLPPPPCAHEPVPARCADFQIVRGDTLRSPAFFSGDSLATFDCVIANPPFSLEKWGEEVWAADAYGRNFAGMPPGKSGDYAWVQHMIKSMAPKTGRMAVVLPHGALFRMGAEGAIRKKLLGMDLLEAVIGLGPNLFYGTGLAACILVFRQKKAPDRRNKVLIVDASQEFKTGRAQNELLPTHVERIHGWVRDYADVPGIARVVALEEIAANDHNLNIPRYVEPTVSQDTLTMDEAMERLRKSAQVASAAEDRLLGILQREGLLQ